MEDNDRKDDLVLANVAETLVKDKTKELIKTMEMCQCQICYMDTCAIALNHIKPLYITTSKGRLLSTLSTANYGYQAELVAEVVKALEQVKKSPKHG